MRLPNDLYPAPGFRFSVAVAESGSLAQQACPADASFQEVSGLEARIDTEELVEGGENRYVHQLPTRTRSPNLVLRRGYVTAPSFLSEWAAQTIGSTLFLPVRPLTLLVLLLDERGQPLVEWNVARAWPVRWVTGPFDSMKNEVLTEVLEFSCAYITRKSLTSAAFPAPQPSATRLLAPLVDTMLMS
ncbi:phage tail protein [Azospirillum sp. sgz302134]